MKVYRRVVLPIKMLFKIRFTGVGKTVIAAEILKKMSASGIFIPVILNFSAQTSSPRTQVYDLILHSVMIAFHTEN